MNEKDKFMSFMSITSIDFFSTLKLLKYRQNNFKI